VQFAFELHHLAKEQKRKRFFFEKKNQKTFIHLAPHSSAFSKAPQFLTDKSLFASFSSEKEDTSFPLDVP
jgi:hypothetical protein